MNTQELNAVIVEALGEQEDFTPYQLAGVASKVVGKYVREQMLYQYVAKELIPSTTGTRQTKKGIREVRVIEAGDAYVWLAKYASKQLNPEPVAEQVETEDMAELTA